MSLLFRGALTTSSHMVLQPALSHVLEKNVTLTVGGDPAPSPDPIDVFGRVYDTGKVVLVGVLLIVPLIVQLIVQWIVPVDTTDHS